jgi:hypothetical protein
MLYGSDDLHIPCAPTEISGNGGSDVLFRWGRISVEERLGAHDHSRCAITTLNSVVLNERFLKGVKLSPLRQSFNGLDFFAHGLPYQHEARARSFAVDDDGARAALAYPAAVLGPRQAQIRTQNFKKRPVRLCLQGIISAVYMELKFHFP